MATFCAPVLTGKHVLMIETFFSFLFLQWVEIISEIDFLFSCISFFHDIVTYLFVKGILHFFALLGLVHTKFPILFSIDKDTSVFIY